PISPQIFLVLLRQRRNGDRNAGKVQTLVVRDRSRHLHAGDDPGAVDLEDTHGDLAVVDEDPVARLAVSGKPLIAGGDQLLGAGHVLSGDGEDVPFGELLGAAREVAETDLRALEVHQHRDGTAGRLGGVAHVAVDHLVLLGGAVRAVDPSDVHTGVDEFLDLLGRRRGRADRADGLRSTHGTNPMGSRPARPTALRPSDTSAPPARSGVQAETATVDGATGAGSSVSPRRNSSTAAAAARPSAMAQTM